MPGTASGACHWFERAANAPFEKFPPAFDRLPEQMLRRSSGERKMVDILALVLQHDEQAVLTLVEPSPSGGVATKTMC